MKTAITSLLTAALLGLAATLTARPFDAADFIAIAFATGLIAWTVDQYGRDEREIQDLGKTVAFEAAPAKVRASARTAERIAA